MTCPLTQSTVTNGVAAAREDCGSPDGVAASLAGAEAASVGAALGDAVSTAALLLESDTLWSVCAPQAARVRVRDTLTAASTRVLFTRRA
jgi:hypothetical protein